MVENSQSSAKKDKKPTTKTSSLTLADRLEILGDLLIDIRKEIPVEIKKFTKNGVNLVVITLQDVDVVDGYLTPK